MGITSSSHVSSTSVDTLGLSDVTSFRDPSDSRRGTIYNGGLEGADPVWFHPLNTGRHVMLMSSHQGPTGAVTEPSWTIVDPLTGSWSGLSSIPMEDPGSMTLVDATSRGDYLFVLSRNAEDKSLLQYFRVTTTGGLVLQAEEWIDVYGLGLTIDGNYLWVFARHEDSGQLGVCRRNWGRIGSPSDGGSEMGWLYRTSRGWSTDLDVWAPLDGEVPADGPVSVASLGGRYYMTVAVASGPSWSAHGYSSRFLDTGWSRNAFSQELGMEGSTYMGGTVRLQPQLGLNPGYATIQTTGGGTVLTSESCRTQVLTGYATHVLSLPASLATLDPFLVYNQSTADVSVTSAGGATITVVERGTGAVLTPTDLEPMTEADWSCTAPSERAPRARSGFPYVLTDSPNTASYTAVWNTTWGVFEV